MEENQEESDDLTNYYRGVVVSDKRKGEGCDRSRSETIESGN